MLLCKDALDSNAMSEKTSITVYESTLVRFNDAKRDDSDEDMPELSADEFLSTLLDTREAVREYGHYDLTGVMDTSTGDELREMQKALQTIEQRTGKIEQLLEDVRDR